MTADIRTNAAQTAKASQHPADIAAATAARQAAADHAAAEVRDATDEMARAPGHAPAKQAKHHQGGRADCPFTRAALLIEVDPDRVVVPEFHEPRERLPMWTLGHMTPFELSPVQYAPTRRPAELRSVLAPAPNSPATLGSCSSAAT